MRHYDDTRWTDHHETGEPVPMSELHRMVWLLGYDPDDVLSVVIEADRVQVMTVVRGQIGHRIVHRHDVAHD